MRESEIEKKITQAVKARKGLCIKWISTTNGWPDRIVLFPAGRVGFIEVKAPGRKPRPLQESRHRLLRKMGFKVYVIDGEGQIGSVLDELEEG